MIKKQIEAYLQVAENPRPFVRSVMASLLDDEKHSEDIILELEKLIDERKHGH